jgi:hypothetical protein
VAFFADLRSRCPVAHHVVPPPANPEAERSALRDALVARPTDEFWSVMGYADVYRMLGDTDTFTSRTGPGPEWIEAPNEEGLLVYADPPAHTRQRQIANKAFVPRIVFQRESRIQQRVDELIDAFAEDGQTELVSSFAAPLSTSMFAEIFGEGRDRLEDFYRWGRATMEMFGGDDAAVAAGAAAVGELYAFLQGPIDHRRRLIADGEEPPDDLLTALITADYNGSQFSNQELLAASHVLFIGGFETTTLAIANAAALLATHPDELAKIERDPSLWGRAVEETLRFEPPLEGLFRSTTTATEIAGCPIPARSKVRWVIMAANRDPEHFTEPDEFRVDRQPAEVRKHVTFGKGPHSCLGAALARAELQIGLETLFRRLPGLEIDPDWPPVRARNFPNNGYTDLHLRWDPARVQPARVQPAGTDPEQP